MCSISVVVCTHNRAESLARTLESMCGLDVPRGLDWELIVVANACSDNTPQVAHAYASRLPLRIVQEETPGLCVARNRGVHEARGVLIALADDDIAVSSSWLAAYSKGVSMYPEVSFFGGAVMPRYPGGRPDWLSEKIEQGVLCGVCVCRPFSRQSREYGLPSDLPFGANVAIRRDVVLARLFRTDLDVQGRSRLCQGETELLRRLLEEGHAGIYLPDAFVWHFTEGKRLRPRFIRAHGYGCGRSDVLSGAPVERPTVRTLARWYPSWYMRRLWLQTLRVGLAGFFGPREGFYRRLYLVAQKWGQVREWRRLDKAGRTLD